MQSSLANTNFFENTNKLIKVFFDNDKFKKNKFREFVLNKLYKILGEIDFLTKSSKYKIFWIKVKDLAAVSDKSKIITIEKILELKKYLEKWIRDSVLSKERFEFFILCKASEINSGDKIYAYYLAQLIRHDQLLSAVLVFSQVLVKLKSCAKIEVGKVLQSKEFIYFENLDIEKKIFVTATRIFEFRNK